MSLFGDLSEGAEILHDRDFLALPAFLEERKNLYDLIWIARTHNFTRILPVLRNAGIDPSRVPIILDTEAITASRDAALAKLTDQDAALRGEFVETQICRRILTVNTTEAGMLRDLGLPEVTVLGTARNAAPTPAPFTARAGLLLVIAIHQQDSQNLDSLHWYLEEILPALAAELVEAPMLHVVGYAAPCIDLSAFAKHPHIKLHGSVGDLTPFYNAARVFVAPTRFAAGTPYKIYEAASFGLPCVATDLLAGQLGWENTEILTAPVRNAPAFARQVARLYHDENLWSAIRANALARLAAENSVEAFYATVRQVVQRE
jgi:O-antigen biosynthesis protein